MIFLDLKFSYDMFLMLRNYYYYANKHDVTHTKNDLKPSECLCTNRPDWKSKAITDTTLLSCPVQRRVKMTGQGRVEL